MMPRGIEISTSLHSPYILIHNSSRDKSSALLSGEIHEALASTAAETRAALCCLEKYMEPQPQQQSEDAVSYERMEVIISYEE